MNKLLLIFLLSTSSLFAQYKKELIIGNKINELKSSGVENFFFYNTYCIGSKRILKIDEVDCSIEGDLIYLFSKENDKTYIQSLGLCNDKIEISNNTFDFFFENFLIIKDEKVELYQTDKQSVTEVSHSCYKKITYLIKDKKIVKKFDEFNLTTKLEKPNINYDLNNGLKLVSLTNLCDKIIKENYNK